MYTSSDDKDDGYYDNFIDEAKAEPTADEPSCDHQHETGWGRGRPPKFFSHPNRTVIRFLSRKNNQTIMEPCPSLREMSEALTNDTQEQALLQGPKARVFLRSLLKLFVYSDELERVPTNLQLTLPASEDLIESSPEPPTYKHQEHYLCFDHDFDIEDDEEAELLWLRLRHESSLRESPLYTQTSSLPSITPTTTPTTAAADLLLTLINQVPAASPQSPLSPFNFSYINVTPPQTTPGPSAHSDTVTSSSSALTIKTVPCNDYGTAILSTTSLERITSYSLLSSHLLIPSQFIKLSHGNDHYCTVSTPTQMPATVPSSSTGGTVTKTFTPPLQDLPSRSVSYDDVSNYLSSFSNAVDVGLTMILTMMILPTILIITFIILPMMVLMLPAVIGTHEEQYVFSDDDMTTNTGPVRPTSVPKTMWTASPTSTSTHASGKRKELCLQQQQFWAFIQKLNHSRIGSSCSGYKWITAILYKLSMTIWTLWQVHNDDVCS